MTIPPFSHVPCNILATRYTVCSASEPSARRLGPERTRIGLTYGASDLRHWQLPGPLHLTFSSADTKFIAQSDAHRRVLYTPLLNAQKKALHGVPNLAYSCFPSCLRHTPDEAFWPFSLSPLFELYTQLRLHQRIGLENAVAS